ncbi:MAG TPA: hypothetical protein VFI70_12505 [Nitrososphaeraceae archaeon]|nr:hypothetical protein [Nitrososphaeraceae archaeon]
MFTPSGQVIIRKKMDWPESSQMPQRAINCLADYTHTGKYNGHVERADSYVLDKTFVPLKDFQDWDWKKY